MNKENVIFTTCGFILGLLGGALLIGPILHARGIVPAFVKETKAAVVDPHAAIPAAGSPASSEPATTGGDPAVMQQVLQQVAALKQRLEANPRDSQAAIQLGNLYMDARKFDQAITFYQQALTIAPNPDVETDLGICYRAKGDTQRALQIFRKVHAENPQHWQSRFNEAIVLMDTGQIEAAKKVVAELASKRPDDQDVKRFAELLAQMKKS